MLALEVREALETLPAAHRQVLVLAFSADLSEAEIAERLDVPVGTVKSRMHHGLRKLQAALEERTP